MRLAAASRGEPGNGLATSMGLFVRGQPLSLEREALRRALAVATGRIALLVHGLLSNEDIWLQPNGSDYGSLLARDTGCTPR